MSIQLTVLGGSAAWPNPGQGCSSYLVDTSEARILIDCGPDTMLELRKHSRLADIDAIVISHCHADHILDLVAMRYALVYSKEQATRRIPLWAPPGGSATLRALGDALGSQGESTEEFWGDVFDLQEYDPARSLQVADCTMTFRLTQHFIACYAMRLEAPTGASLVYGADTGSTNDLVDFAAGAQLLVSEATADTHDGVEPESRGHLIPEDAGAWAAEARVSRLLLTHLWYEREDSDVVERAARHYDGPIDVAKPGLTIYV